MKSLKKSSPIFGGILLVSGTTVGAAMLAFPVSTAFAGLFPALLLFFVCWIYLIFTSLLFVEALLWLEKKDVNIISLARHTLGRGGVLFTWVVYLFLLYSLLTAYIAASGPIFSEGFFSVTNYPLPNWASTFCLLAIFGYAVHCGTKTVDYINRVMMVGFIVTFIALLAFTFPSVETSRLESINFSPLLLAVSVVATAFGFHIVIPSLIPYLDGNHKAIIKVILIGGTIPLVMYILWEIAALGALPLEGPSGLMSAYYSGGNAAYLLATALGHPYLAAVATIFSFCAIITSFLGVALSLTHFLADGLKIKEEGLGEFFVSALTFIPPTLIAWTNPRAFLSALEYAGAFGVVSLLGLLPAIIVWRGRYTLGYKSPLYKAPGGKCALIAIAAFSCAIMFITALQKLGYLDFLLQ